MMPPYKRKERKLFTDKLTGVWVETDSCMSQRIILHWAMEKSEVATSWVSHNNMYNDVSVLYFWVQCLTSERIMITFNEDANFTV